MITKGFISDTKKKTKTHKTRGKDLEMIWKAKHDTIFSSAFRKLYKLT